MNSNQTNQTYQELTLDKMFSLSSYELKFLSKDRKKSPIIGPCALTGHVQGFEKFLVDRINSLLEMEVNPKNRKKYYPKKWDDNPYNLEMFLFGTIVTRFIICFFRGWDIIMETGQFFSFSKEFDINVSFIVDWPVIRGKEISFRILADSKNIRKFINGVCGNVNLKTDVKRKFICIDGFHNSYYMWETKKRHITDVLFKFYNMSSTERVKLVKKFARQVFLPVKSILSRAYDSDVNATNKVSHLTFDDFWKEYEYDLLEWIHAYYHRYSVYNEKFDELCGPSIY